MTELNLYPNSGNSDQSSNIAGLEIVDLDGEFVVDSRLVAKRLDIDHESFMRTVKKHQTLVESKFGRIRFKFIDVPMPKGGIRQEVSHALLNENQSTVLMTFSRNTPIVIQCKIDLVDAFSKAKQVIKSFVKPQQSLPSRELALATAQSVSEIKDLLGDTDPRLCQFLVDVAMNDALQTLKAIAPASTQWLGVVEIAESLGLPVTTSNRVALGKFVKSVCGNLGKQEQRICNGRTMPIWCYPSSDRTVENAVRQFFN